MRNMRARRYAVAAVITLGIFLLGLMLGFVVEGKRITLVQDLFQEQKSEFSSSQLQYAYVASLESQDACAAIYGIFFDNLRDLDDTAHRLETYVQDSKINDESFAVLKRAYTIEQLRYWLLSKQAKEICEEDLVRVLYFFSTDEECPDCDKQAFVLDYLKKIYGGKLLIFSLDANFEQEPMISILKSQYGIKQYPTLVVEDTKLEGFSSVEELEDQICDLFEKSTPECEA